MSDELNLLVSLKEQYSKQVSKIEDDWNNKTSRFKNKKDYYIQLNIWEKRIKEYEKRISLIEQNG